MTHTSTNVRVENGTASITETTYDEDDRPIAGVTKPITLDEAEELMTGKKTDDTKMTTTMEGEETTPIDNNVVTEKELQAGNESLGMMDGKEKPASMMSEADAVALNSDVHVATPQQSPRVVTQGQVDQVESGLHSDATEGKPLIKEEDSQQQPQPEGEDLHVREPSKK